MRVKQSIVRGIRLFSFYRHPSRQSCLLQTSPNFNYLCYRFPSFITRSYYTTLGTDMDKEIDVAGMRKPYHGIQEVFDTKDLTALDPFDQFTAWFKEACDVPSIKEANAMSLATATKDGHPSVRMVLLKGYDKTGFKFFSNYESRKASELDSNGFAALLLYWSNNDSENTWSRQVENPNAALMFYWESMMRSVRIEGRVEKLSQEVSTDYFHSRPRTSQIGAIVSPQSQVIECRSILDKRNSELIKQYEDESVTIPKPDHWGGYKLIPNVIEFWQGQTNRLHDRLVFRRRKDGEILDEKVSTAVHDGWILERLAP